MSQSDLSKASGDDAAAGPAPEIPQTADRADHVPPGSDLAHDLLARVRAAAASGAAVAARTAPFRSRARRGAPPRPVTLSGAGDDGRDPQRIGSLVDGLVSDQGWQTQLSVGGVEAGWASVVGPAIAEHCHPEGFREGVLAVRAESTAWATQVRLLAPTVLARLAAELGDGVVTRIEVLGPTGPSWRKGRLRVPGRGPRDTYG